VQYLAQEALRRAVKENHAKGGTIVVMDAHTGDVYSMASYPWFDPNDFERANREAVRNRAVTDMFEPGSVNKVVTAAAALESGAVGVREIFQVPWWMHVGGYTVNDAEQHPIQDMTLGDIVAHSSNIGSAMVAERVGSAELASVLGRFGYGTPTGVGFPGEAGGVVPELLNWSDITRATVSYGQGISMTPLQMAAVYATVANEGMWVQPRLVRANVPRVVPGGLCGRTLGSPGATILGTVRAGRVGGARRAVDRPSDADRAGTVLSNPQTARALAAPARRR